MVRKKTLTRADIADAIIGEFKVSRFDATEVIEDVLEAIAVALKEGESVKISGFGTFSVRQKNERMGRNPKTMEEALISSRKSLTFRPSPILKKIVNEKQ